VTTAASSTLTDFSHPAFLYAGTGDFLEYMVPYVEDGLDHDEVVFVASHLSNVRALRKALGARARQVRFADTTSWYPHPAHRLHALHQLAIDATSDGPAQLRLASEPVWPKHPELVHEWQRYESALNDVLSVFSGSLVCLYDEDSLDPSIIEVAEATHPHVHHGTERGRSAHFEPPDEFLRRWITEPLAPTSEPRRVTTVDELRAVRAELLRLATRAGLPVQRAQDLCLASNEILTNALVYGSGPVDTWTSIEDDEWFVVGVRDHGRGITDPLVGYRPPSAFGEGGRGVWLARQVLDLLQVVPTEAGTIAKLSMRI
jgi:anti-sigma regulatory factor (Ser/Thr protein kinase)